MAGRRLGVALRGALLSELALVAALVLCATPAQAHTELDSVEPPDGSSIVPGRAVVLTFTGEVDAAPPFARFESATGVLDVAPAAAGASLTLEVPDLADGPIVLRWRVVAGDGHPVEGSLTYTVLGAVATTATDSPTSAGAAAEPSPSVPPAPAPTPGAAPADEPAADGLALVAGLGGLGAVGGAAAVMVARRRRSR